LVHHLKKSLSELVPSGNFVPIVISLIIFAFLLVVVLGNYGFNFIVKDDGSMNVYNPTDKERSKPNLQASDEEILEYIRNNIK